MDGENVSDYLEEDIFSALEAWESASNSDNNNNSNLERGYKGENSFQFQKSSGYNKYYSETESDRFGSPKCKRQKAAAAAEGGGDEPRMSHITVERNRRKQMNDNLSLLRSLLPAFYVKRGDQASIIGGVVEYITALQHLIQSLEAKRQRKLSYSEILSPRPGPISPRKPPLSPRPSLPVSPRTPQPSSYVHQPYGYPVISSPSPRAEPSPCNSSNSSAANELAATSKSAVAEVEVKFSGPNVVLRTVSRWRGAGQAVRIAAALEELDLEILHVKISAVDERVLNSFTIKIGIECQLSAEELAHQIHQTFC